MQSIRANIRHNRQVIGFRAVQKKLSPRAANELETVCTMRSASLPLPVSIRFKYIPSDAGAMYGCVLKYMPPMLAWTSSFVLFNFLKPGATENMKPKNCMFLKVQAPWIKRDLNRIREIVRKESFTMDLKLS
jgi:hypothetical protein